MNYDCIFTCLFIFCNLFPILYIYFVKVNCIKYVQYRLRIIVFDRINLSTINSLNIVIHNQKHIEKYFLRLFNIFNKKLYCKNTSFLVPLKI